MNPHLSVFCVYICITICSTEKLKSGVMSEKEDLEKLTSNHKKRPTFKTKEDIPADYLNKLVKDHAISEDPLGDFEREEKKFREEHGYSYYYDEQDSNTYTTTVDEDDSDSFYNYITRDDEVPEVVTNTTDSNETCKGCEMREREKALRLEQIKQTLLFKLGFSSNNLPNASRKSIPNIPAIKRIMEAHDMQGDAPYPGDDDFIPEDEIYGQVKRAYTIGQITPERLAVDVPGACYFDLPESVTSRRIQDSSLWIYLRPDKHKKEHHKNHKNVYEIYVYIIQPKAKPQHILKSPVRYKKTTSSGWFELKMAHIVHHWAKQPDQNRGVVIQAFDSEGRNVVVTPENTDEEQYFPILEMSTVEHNDHHHRSKRYANNVCSETDRVDSCCRYALRVDFVDFGWDWVIAPTGYQANYCSGECRYRHMENNPQAYLIQQVPDDTGPCCTPSKYYPLAMLYFDHEHTVLYTFMQKMIVDRCGCA